MSSTQSPFSDKKVQDELLALINSGKTFKGACKLLSMDERQGYSYLLKDSVYAGLVNQARTNGADALVDELLEVADDESYDPARARIKSENIRWAAARINRTKYGDRLDVSIEATVNVTQAITDGNQRVEKMRQAIDITEDCAVIDDGKTSEPPSIVD